MSSVLIIDDQKPFAEALGNDFAARGFAVELCDDFSNARADRIPFVPTTIVSELRVRGRTLFQHHDALQAEFPEAALAVVTAYPSVAGASTALRRGARCYLSKPARVDAILRQLHSNDDDHTADEDSWPSLNRTIWEYLHQVYTASGSMSEAARRMQLDRRSLRRMLQRHPPIR